MSKNSTIINPTAIKEINVEQLFGHYTYNLCKTEKSKDLSKLIILYGENGSGKTTILKLIFYLLSYVDKEGHKSSLARYKFKKFSVLFNNGVEIGASRTKCNKGAFTYYIKKNNKLLFKIHLKTIEPNCSIVLDDNSKEGILFHKITEYIKKINIRLFYLTDNRKTMDTLPRDIVKDDDYEEISRGASFRSRLEPRRHKKQTEYDERGLILNYKMIELADWIRKHAIMGSIEGEKDTISVYTSIVKKIINSKNKTKKDLSKLVHTLKQLTKRSKEYAQIGLITSLEYENVADEISEISEKHINDIYNVIEPFTEGLKKRLDALEELKNTISMLINTVNEHFIDKKISYDVPRGFTITHIKSGEEIEFDNLSSGENQFLLLIASTITAREEASLFIIDEPEISLNVKWQRELIKTLLEFGKNNRVQFLIATHSIELLTGYRSDLVILKS